MAGATVVPAGAWVSENDRAGKVKVTVVANAETQVTVTNQPAARHDQGLQVEREPGAPGRAVQLHGQRPDGDRDRRQVGRDGRAARPRSRPRPGTKLKIQESVPAGEQVAGVTFNGAAVTATAGLVQGDRRDRRERRDLRQRAGRAAADRLHRGLQGRGDEFVSPTTPFTFTITDRTGVTDDRDGAAGQCTGPIKVAAGNVDRRRGRRPTASTSRDHDRAEPERARADQPLERDRDRRRAGRLEPGGRGAGALRRTRRCSRSSRSAWC